MLEKYCRNCGRCSLYGTTYSGRYVCESGKSVDALGVCDRWVKEHYGEKEIKERIDKSLERMKDFQEGTYKIIERVPLGTNYRVIKKSA